jgi:hypothetical protein
MPELKPKDDPAFLYFPTNYRWSMGLLICLSGAPGRAWRLVANATQFSRAPN